ncbi:unnamed protein product [Caenorhabditis brenneri]
MSTSITIPFKDAENVPSKVNLAIAQVVYGVPSALLMVFLLFFLGCSKQYSSSFYRIVQVDLLTNLICWLNTWISLRSSEFPAGTAYIKFILYYIPWIWNVSCFLLNFFFNMQFLSAVWMSVHRISSILFFQSYEKFWSRYYLLLAVVFCIYSCLPQVLSSGHSPRMALVNGSLYYTFDMAGTASFTKSVNILSVIYFIVLVGLGIAVPLVAAKKFEGAMTDSQVSKKLTRIALTYGVVYSGILFWNIVNAFQNEFKVFPDGFGQISYSLLSVASDLMTLALPYILLFFDSNIKRDLRPGRDISSTTPMVVST